MRVGVIARRVTGREFLDSLMGLTYPDPAVANGR